MLRYSYGLMNPIGPPLHCVEGPGRWGIGGLELHGRQKTTERGAARGGDGLDLGQDRRLVGYREQDVEIDGALPRHRSQVSGLGEIGRAAAGEGNRRRW